LMRDTLDIVMPAVRRPEILDKALESWKPFFAGYDCRLIVNLDALISPEWLAKRNYMVVASDRDWEGSDE